MNIRSMDPRTQRAFALLGPSFAIVFFIGFLMAGQLPPTSPSDSSAEIADYYSDNKTIIRIGCTLMVVAFSCFAPWGAAIAMWTRRSEGGFPLWTYVQLACLGASTCIVVLIPTFWVIAAYRPDDTDPNITRFCNDAAWFLFLFTWPPFSIWTAAVGVAILKDPDETPVFPRWTGFLSLWTAFLLAPALGMAFFKTGPLAYDGVLAFYVPLVIFFTWVISMTTVMMTRVKLEEQRSKQPEATEMTYSEA